MSWLSKLFTSKRKKPTVKQIYSVSWSTVKQELTELGLELMLKEGYKPDQAIYYCDEEDWKKLVPFLTFSGEPLFIGTEAIPDCDDWAKKASVEAAFEFHVSCLETWGNTPYSRHAFSLVKKGDKAYDIFEPNAAFGEAGELFHIGEHSYNPNCWRL